MVTSNQFRRLRWVAGGLLAVSVVVQPAAAQTPLPVWPWIATGGGSQGSDRFDKVAADASGRAVVAGIFRKTVTFGTTTLTAPGNQDNIVVAKLSPTGAYEWVQHGGSLDDDDVKAVRIGHNGHVYITGFAPQAATFGATVLPAPGTPGGGGGYVACLDGATGAWLWAVRTPGNSYGTALALDAADNVYVGGMFADTVAFGSTQLVAPPANAFDLFVAKLSGTGAHPWQWVRTAGGPNNESVTAIALDVNGNLYMGGYYLGPSLTFGSTILTNAGNVDSYVAKLTPMGVWRSATNVGGGGGEYVQALDVTPSGRVAVGGFFSAQTGLTTTTIGGITLTNAGRGITGDGFVAQLSPTGVVQWATALGGTANDGVATVSAEPGGTVIATAYIDSRTAVLGDSTCTNSSDPGALADSYVLRLTPAGTGASCQLLGRTRGGNCEFTRATTFDAAGNLYVAGCFATPFTPALIGTFSVSSSGQFDAFVTKLVLAGPTGLSAPGRAAGGLLLWPNPARAAVRVSGAVGSIELLDALGRVVWSKRGGAPGVDAVVPLSGLTPGIYTVRAGAARQRLVVE